MLYSKTTVFPAFFSLFSEGFYKKFSAVLSILTVISTGASTVSAESVAKKSKAQASIGKKSTPMELDTRNLGHRELMNKALDYFLGLMPYISSSEKYLESKNSDPILEKLKGLSEVFKAANQTSIHQSDLFQSTGIAIEDNIKVAKEAFDKGNKHFSYMRLKETVQLCFHCHTQLPKEYVSSFFEGVKKQKREHFDNDLDYAQYLFLVRSFDESIIYYQKFINGLIQKTQKLTQKDQVDLEAVLKQILTIMVKVWRNPEKTKNFLVQFKPFLEASSANLVNSDSSSKKPTLARPSQAIIEEIISWNEQLDYWQTHAKLLPQELKSHQDFINFVNQVLSPSMLTKNIEKGSSDISLLLSSGLLAHYLFLNPSEPDRALVLYYLGLAEKELNTSSFYALAENYLRECVVQYPSHPIAKSCYAELEDLLKFGYTGSRGEDMPSEIKAELLHLKELLAKPFEQTNTIKDNQKNKKIK